MIVKLVSFFFLCVSKGLLSAGYYYSSAFLFLRMDGSGRMSTPAASFFWSTSSRVLLSSEPHSSRPSFSAGVNVVCPFRTELAFYLVFGHWTRLCRRCPHPPTEREAGGRWTSFARRPGCCVDPFFRGLKSIHRTVPFFVCLSLVHLGAAVCSRYLVLTRFPND